MHRPDCRCESYWCVDDKCHKAAGDPRRPATWVYIVVAICIALRECSNSGKMRLQPG